MSWQKEIDELNKRKNLAQELGGKEKVERQHKANRNTIRERINLFFDKDSFQEFGMLSGQSSYKESGELENFLPANSIIGHGLVNQQSIAFYGDDFTVRGGAADASFGRKW